MNKQFEKQMSECKPLTEEQINKLQDPKSFFGKDFEVGDIILYAVFEVENTNTNSLSIVYKMSPITKSELTDSKLWQNYEYEPDRGTDMYPSFRNKKLWTTFGD